MLSGVGPKEHLAEHRIPLVHDLPGVGQNLMDHIQVPTRFRVNDSLRWVMAPPSDRLTKLKLLKAVVQWNLFGTGPLSTNVSRLYFPCQIRS